MFCLVPDYDPATGRRRCERLGFEPAGEYMSMAKRLAKPVEELAPETIEQRR